MTEEMKYKKPVSVLVIVHTLALEVLLLERAGHSGYWQSVTGAQEGDEALIDAARREVAEETGIDAQKYPLLDWRRKERYRIFEEWRHRYAPGVLYNTEHVFSLCLPAPLPVVLAPCEHRAWRWLPLEAAAGACFSPSNRDCILALPEMLSR
ncbi:MAG: dihydroneopterin triphosphate diphosphatase [Betaproteobacteria bacterium]|nr:dihydroneopterin triphosphate diphosphatase [Betaproteobacteria bacterium]